MCGSVRLILPLASAFACATVSGCNKIPAPKLGGSVNYYTFSKGKEVGKELDISTDSPLFKSIEVWLIKKRKWKRDKISYAPGQVIESDLVRVNVAGNVVVLSVRKNENDNWDQYSCEYDKETEKLFQDLHHEWESTNMH